MSRSSSQDHRYTSAKERAEKQSTGFQAPYLKLPEKVHLFKPKEGVMLIDILPFKAGSGNPWAEEGRIHWERTFYVHRGLGANSDSYLCPRMNSKSRCPVCEHRLVLMKKGDPEMEERVKEMLPKQRQLFNIRDLRDPDKGLQLWDISYHLFGKVLDARLRNSDEEDDWGRFFFIEDGLTLKVAMVEKSFGGFTYMEAETIDFKQRAKQYKDSVLERVFCLDHLLVEPSYDKLEKIYLEGETADDDDDEPRGKKKPPVDDDEPPRVHSSESEGRKKPTKDDDWD